jgi:hypothetical protein
MALYWKLQEPLCWSFLQRQRVRPKGSRNRSGSKKSCAPILPMDAPSGTEKPYSQCRMRIPPKVPNWKLTGSGRKLRTTIRHMFLLFLYPSIHFVIEVETFSSVSTEFLGLPRSRMHNGSLARRHSPRAAITRSCRTSAGTLASMAAIDRKYQLLVTLASLMRVRHLMTSDEIKALNSAWLV